MRGASTTTRITLVLLAVAGLAFPREVRPADTPDPAPAARLSTLPRPEREPPLGVLHAPNDSGVAETLHASGTIDLFSAFFRALGTNGRSCETCHQARDGWSITPASVQARFHATGGDDPAFRPNDGSTSPHADVATFEARRVAYRLLLDRALIRVGLPMPTAADFDLERVDDPYDFASSAELSLFRRPLPATNLALQDTVMWDGRETLAEASPSACIVGTDECFATHAANLARQANGATVGHAQAAQPLTDAQREEIVAFEIGLTTAQRHDAAAGDLAAAGARGGADAVGREPFWFGINDFAYGDYRGFASFDAAVFRLYGAWADANAGGAPLAVADARRAIARGEQLFNTRTFTVNGIAGFNDRIGVRIAQVTCGACHDAPNSGASSIPAFMDIGVAAETRRTPDVPLYTFRHKATGERLSTTDPGRGLITGRWDDLGKFKVPSLRALASRPPYFHDGSAPDLAAVVDFYDKRFRIRLSPQDVADLVAFLKAL